MRWPSRNNAPISDFGVSGQVSAPPYPHCFVCCFCICLPTNDLRVSAQSFGKLIPSPTSPVFRGSARRLERSGLNRPRHPRKITPQHPPFCLPLREDFPLFLLWSEEFKSYPFPCLLFCVLYVFDKKHAKLHDKHGRIFDENSFWQGQANGQCRTNRQGQTSWQGQIENIQKDRVLFAIADTAAACRSDLFWCPPTGGFCNPFHPFSYGTRTNHSSTRCRIQNDHTDCDHETDVVSVLETAHAGQYAIARPSGRSCQ